MLRFLDHRFGAAPIQLCPVRVFEVGCLLALRASILLWGFRSPYRSPLTVCCARKLVGVAGFEPATPSSRTG